MICDASEGAGGEKRTDDLLQLLCEQDWSVRRDAVRGLTAQATDDSIEQLLSVIREQHRDLSRLNGAVQVLARTPVDVVPQLLELLSHPDPEVRSYTALTLGERGDPRAVAGLIAALADSDANVRMHSVEALGKLRAAAAVDTLIKLAEAMDFELAFPAIDALISIGDERIAYRLLPLLSESLFKVITIEALGRLGDGEVVKPLLDMLADVDVPPGEIVIALSRIQERYQQRFGDHTSIPEHVRSLASPANVQALIAASSLMSPVGTSSGAMILSWLPGPNAAEALVNLLDRPPISDEVVRALVSRGPSIVPLLVDRLATATDGSRKAIIETLARLGDRSAIPGLLQTLDPDGDEDLLVRTVDSLARLADERAYEPLRGLLGHTSSRVRQSVVAAISSLGHPNTADDLLPGFRDPSPLVRESCVKVAAYLGLPSCVDSLFDCCGDPDERVRRATIESLPTFDDPRVYQRLGQAIRTDTPSVRAAAAAALAKVDDAAASAELLADALADGDVWVRYFSISSLHAIKKQETAVETLMQLAIGDPAPQVRVVAIEALGECGPVALPALLELSHSTAPDLANAALLALGNLRHPEAKQVLIEALYSRDSERRSHAIRALIRTNSPEVVEPLRVGMLGSDDRLAAEATLALRQLQRREAALALIGGASVPARRDSCIAALASMSDSAVPALAYGLRTLDLDTRRAIVEVLSRIRSPKAVEALAVALEDQQPAVRQAALSSLAHIRQTRRTGPAETCEGNS